MGTTCSCITDSGPERSTELRDIQDNSSNRSEAHDSVPKILPSDQGYKYENDSLFDGEISGLSNITPENRAARLLKKHGTSEMDRGSTFQDDSTDKTFKKTVSFFQYSQQDRTGKYNPSLVELTNPHYGDDWNVKNIKLEKCLKFSPQTKYVWEAFNTLLNKKCILTILVFDYQRLSNTNFAKTEAVMKDILGINATNVIKYYSCSIFDTRQQGKLYYRITIVQELARCSIADINRIKLSRSESWSEAELLPIISDVYDGLTDARGNNVSHSQLDKQNILFSDDLNRVMVTGFDIKIPITSFITSPSNNGMITTPTKSAFSKSQNKLTDERSTQASNGHHYPHKQDLKALAVIIMQLILKVEEFPEEPEQLIRDNEKIERVYPKLYPILKAFLNPDGNEPENLKTVDEYIMELQKQGNRSVPNLTSNANLRMYQGEDQDIIKLKIETYEWLKNYKEALPLHLAILSSYEKIQNKNTGEQIEHIVSLNKTLKTYVALREYEKASELSKKITPMLKDDKRYKTLIKNNPGQYINLTFSLGAINEGLNKLDKAIKFYLRGLNLCLKSNVTLDNYPEALRRLSSLYLAKGDPIKAFEYLKKLADHYDTKENQYLLEKTDVYFNLGDISCKFNDFGKAVKCYLKSLECLKKAKPDDMTAQLELLENIAEKHRKLNDNDQALKFFQEAMSLRKTLYGKDSIEYASSSLKVAEIYQRQANHKTALELFRSYHELSQKNASSNNNDYEKALIGIGKAYYYLKDFDKALQYCEKASDFYRLNSRDQSEEFIGVNDIISEIYFKQKKYDQSIFSQEGIMEYKIKRYQDTKPLKVIIAFNNIGDTYYAFGDYTNALLFHQKAFEILEPMSSTYTQEWAQLNMNIAYDYEKLGQHGKALDSVFQSLRPSDEGQIGRNTDMESTIKVYEELGKVKDHFVIGITFDRLARISENK